jgi:hypothetical protein
MRGSITALVLGLVLAMLAGPLAAEPQQAGTAPNASPDPLLSGGLPQNDLLKATRKALKGIDPELGEPMARLERPKQVRQAETAKPPAMVYTYRHLLRFIPDTPRLRTWIVLNDMSRAVATLQSVKGGVPRPGPQADSRAVADHMMFLRQVMAEGPYISGFSNYYNADLMKILKENAGYDLRNVDQTVSAARRPGDLHAITLNRETTSIKTQLLASSTLPRAAVEMYRAIPILSWGPDFRGQFVDRLQPPAHDDLGTGGRLAFLDRVIFRAAWTDGVKAMIDASTQRRRSLADVNDIVLVADRLEKLNVFSALISDNTQRREALMEKWNTTEQRKALEGLIALKPYGVFGTGIGKDHDGFYTGMVLVHKNNVQARANLERLRAKLEKEGSLFDPARPAWSTFFDLQRLALSTDEGVLIAKLPFVWGNDMNSRNRVWNLFVEVQDPLLLHE